MKSSERGPRCAPHGRCEAMHRRARAIRAGMYVKRPSIRQLEVFCRVVQLNSMARAAKELQLAPSSVSMQIHELERRYRTRLLVRSPRRTTPTAAGTALYTRVLSLLEGPGHGRAAVEVARVSEPGMAWSITEIPSQGHSVGWRTFRRTSVHLSSVASERAQRS
jgi:DNA-binding CsgD family transcriptional regulator